MAEDSIIGIRIEQSSHDLEFMTVRTKNRNSFDIRSRIH